MSPSSISAIRSFWLTGDNFVRLALISRSAHRRRIAVSRLKPSSTERGCSVIVGAFSAAHAISVTLASDTASSIVGRSTEVPGGGSARVEMGQSSRNSSAILSFSCRNLSALISSPLAPALPPTDQIKLRRLAIFLNGSLRVFALRRTAKAVRFRALAIVSTLLALRTSARSFLSCSAGSKALVASPSFPLRLQLKPFQRKPDHVGASLNRVNSPIQFYGDDFGADARLCHPSKEGILLWCPPAAAAFDHVGLFPLRLQPQLYKPADGFEIEQSRSSAGLSSTAVSLSIWR